MTRPLILITNDDGYRAPGIVALQKALATFADTVVVAPESQQSATGQSISLHKPVRLKEIEADWYACSGTPTDCVYIALHHVLDRAPDLVASGINYGANLGPDLMYSGTVGAAREAAQAGYQAIAFSLASVQPGLTFDAQAEVARRLCLLLLEEQMFEPEELINVNFPAEVDPDVTPWKVCTLGKRHYSRQITRQLDPRGKPYYWVGGKFLGHDDIPGSDCNAIDDGLISITPVHLQAVSDPSFQRLDALVATKTPNG